MSKKQPSVMDCSNRAQLEKIFISTVQELAYTRRNVEVFRDFVNLSACAFRNSIPFAFSQDVESVETLDKPFTVDFKEARQLELFAV